MNSKILYLILTVLTCILCFSDANASGITYTYRVLNNVMDVSDLSAVQLNDQEPEYEDDFSPGQFFLVMVMLAFALFCVGSGVVVTILVLLILFGLVMTGILSTSVIVALNKRSFTRGFKTFMILCSSLAGLFAGGPVFWLLNGYVLEYWSGQHAFIWGACAGMLAGLVLGLLAFNVIRELSSYFMTKLRRL